MRVRKKTDPPVRTRRTRGSESLSESALVYASTRHGAKQYYIDINVAICFTQILAQYAYRLSWPGASDRVEISS